MNSSLLICLALILPNIGAVHFPKNNELGEGDPCDMEDGTAGECTRIANCPMRIQEVKSGMRFATSRGRCTFDGFVEIVCCPNGESPKLSVVNDQPPASEKLTEAPTTMDSVMLGNREGETKSPLMEILTSTPESETSTTETSTEVMETTTIVDREKDKDDKPIFFLPTVLGVPNLQYRGFPFTTALGYKPKENSTKSIQYNCGGTLITIRHILITANCIEDHTPIEVRLRNFDIPIANEQMIPIEEMVVYPNYIYRNVAILKLSKVVTASQHVDLWQKQIPWLCQTPGLCWKFPSHCKFKRDVENYILLCKEAE